MNSLSVSTDAPATLTPVPALSDNYIWMVQKNGHAVVVDPGEAGPVLQQLPKGCTLEAILITHHHHDHTGGMQALQQLTGAHVYGPRLEKIPGCDTLLGEGDEITLPGCGLQFKVLDIPGHTAGHIAYTGQISPGTNIVFCGDTLFAAGCGRVFEGTPAQMLQSLSKIASLAPDTLVCCAHEYTAPNIRWALQVEPANTALQTRAQETTQLRAQGLPTVPSRLGLELQTNPFLRTWHPDVQAAANQHAATRLTTPETVFACLREWKNNFR